VTAPQDTASGYRTYGNWRLGRKAGLFGLGPAGTAVAFIVMVISAFMITISFFAALWSLLIGALLLAPMAIRINGRTGFQAMSARVSWWMGRSKRQHVYLSGIASPVTEFHTLPGILARSQVYEVEAGPMGVVGIVVVPQSRHYTITLRCQPEGTDLVDQSAIDTRVGRYANWLSSLCREPMLVQAQITTETTPDPGTLLSTEVSSTLKQDAPDLAKQVLAEVVQRYPAGSAQVDTRVSLTYSPPVGRKMSTEDMCREIAARVVHMHAGLTGAGGSQISAMSANELAISVRAGYDPADAPDLAVHSDLDLDWSQAGPVSAREAWDHYRHDSGFSRTWGMVEAPRGVVFSNMYSRLTVPDPELLRKRVSIVYRPYGPMEAARLVEADKRDARFLASRKSNPTARDLVDLAAADQAASEEATGAGIIRFTVMVTATVATEEELEKADNIIMSHAGEARLFMRTMYGTQAAAFAAGLPTGIVLSKHATIPF
jgi:hypothetical protein